MTFDLSGLGSLTRVHVYSSYVGGLPTLLVGCCVEVESDFDFSACTNLTWLSVALLPDVLLTFPTQLKELRFWGLLGRSNIANVALET